MDNFEPDLDTVKKHLEIQEQVLRIEKMRRELQRDDRRILFFDRIKQFIREAINPSKPASFSSIRVIQEEAAKENTSIQEVEEVKKLKEVKEIDEPDEGNIGSNLVGAIVIAVGLAVIAVFFGVVFVANLLNSHEEPQQPVFKTGSVIEPSATQISDVPVNTSSVSPVAGADIVPIASANVAMTLPSVASKSVSIPEQKIESHEPVFINTGKAKLCDEEYQRFLNNSAGIDLGTFARLNKIAVSKRERCKSS